MDPSFLAVIFLVVVLKKFPLRTAQGLTEADQLKVGDSSAVMLNPADFLLNNIEIHKLQLGGQLGLGKLSLSAYGFKLATYYIFVSIKLKFFHDN